MRKTLKQNERFEYIEYIKYFP